MGNCGNSFAQSVLVLFLWSITSVVGSRSAFSVVTDAVPRIISKKLSTNEVKRPARDCWVKVCESCHIWSLWRLLQNVANTNIQSFPQLRARSDHMNQDESSTLVALTLSSARSSLIMFKSFTWLYSQHWTFNLPLNLWRFSCVQRTNQPWEDSDFHRQLLQARPILDSRARTLQTNPRRRIRRRSKATVVAAVAKSNMQIVAEPNYKPQPCTTFSDYSYRRKFRRQTSDNIDRWKAEQGRGREKRKIRRKKSRRERVRRKKMQMREKVGKSRNTVFFQWFVALGGRKVGLEGHFQVKMYGAPQRRTTFGGSDDRKIARCCGAKQILKWKCYKTHHARTTFEGSDVASIRFTALHYSALHVHYTGATGHYTTLQSTTCTTTTTQLHNYGPLHWRFRLQLRQLQCAARLLHATSTISTVHYTALHYTTLGVRTTLHWRFTTCPLRFASTALHYITLHYTTLHYTTTTTTTTQLHSTTLNYTTLHYITLHYTPLHYTTLPSTTLHYITLHYTPLHYNYNYITTLHYTKSHYITFHYTTFHYTPLQYTTLHCTTLHWMTLHHR